MVRDELIFWFDQPPKVGKGTFNYVSKVWGNKVIYVCVHDYNATRKMACWDDGDFGNAEVIMLADCENREETVKSIFAKYPKAIHVLGGFRSQAEDLIRDYILHDDIRITVFSERPGIYGKPIKKLFKRIYIPFVHKYIAWRYRDKVAAYFTLGGKGVDVNIKYGWPKDLLYPFMYDPVDYSDDAFGEMSTHQTIKLLYVGRFSKVTKGTDVLIKAINSIKSHNWTLDMVGGYGDLKEYTLSWANNHPQVSFKGTWPSTQVCRRMKDYDVCVIPSRFDGWNLLVNEAIRANIGIIVTDEAVSDELVSSSGAGMIVPAGDAKALSKAVEIAVNNPEQINLWKQKAKAYAHRISTNMVGDYFIDIMDYVFYKKSTARPMCPWLKKRED